MKKIEVLYICHTNHLGGAALSLYNLISSVRDQVKPIVLLPQKGQAFDLFVQNNIKCIVYPFKLNIRERNTIKHYIKYIPRYLRDYYVNQHCVNYISQNLKGHNISIVHSNSSVFTIGVKLAKILHAKHVWHIREFQDIDFDIQPFSGWKNLKKKIYTSDAVIAITKAVYEHWQLKQARKAYYIWDAVRSSSDIVLQMPKQKFFFFCAANLCEAKGTSFVIKAFGLSGLASIGYKLIIAGNCANDYRIQLNTLINEYNICNSIDFIGYCSDIKQYMVSATAFLMCSENEGLGRVTVEAMFYGCPIIARNTGGTLEFIKDKENGHLISDINSCAEIMKQIATNIHIEILKSAQNFARENFSEEKYGIKIINIYKDLITTTV